MTKKIVFALALCLGATLASAAPKREVSASRSETITAKVKSVDQKTRMVTVTGEDGSETTFKAGDKVRNLKQVKPGDEVNATLYQTLTLWVLGENEAAPELKTGTDVYRAPAGQKPAGTVASDLQGVATVEEIAKDQKSITLKGPRGNLVQLAVRNPKNLEGVKVGTRIGFAYTEELAVDVTTPKKAKKK
jgi:Cu/Ag efflux protein CusF